MNVLLIPERKKKLGKIGYLLKRIKTMDKKAMFDKIDSIHKKTGKSKIYLLYDMFKCARKYGGGLYGL